MLPLSSQQASRKQVQIALMAELLCGDLTLGFFVDSHFCLSQGKSSSAPGPPKGNRGLRGIPL